MKPKPEKEQSLLGTAPAVAVALRLPVQAEMTVDGGPLDLGQGWQRLVLLLSDITFGNATSFLLGRSLVGLATTVNEYSWTLQEDFPLIAFGLW